MTNNREIITRMMLLSGARPADVTTLATIFVRLTEQEWAEIVTVARGARLSATIDAYLRSCGLLHLLPLDVQATLHEEHKSSQLRYFQYVYSLTQISEILTPANIPFLLLKGQALAAQAYMEPATRSAVDIDLWVRPGDLQRTLDLMLKQKMLLVSADSTLLPFRLAFGNEVALIAGDGSSISMPIDLHWHLAGAWWLRATIQMPDEPLFDRPHELVIGSRTYRTLDPTDTVWYLCLHAGVGHQFEGLGWLVDLALMLQKHNVDWQRLNTLAARSGTEVIVWRSMELLDRALGSSYRARLDRRPSAQHRKLVRKLLPGFPRKMQPAEELESELRVPAEQLVLLRNPATVLRALAYLLWPPRRWVQLRYGVPSRMKSVLARAGHLARLRHLFLEN